MGFIPIFITASGACILFFLTVLKNLRRKIERQNELFTQLNSIYPQLELAQDQLPNPEQVVNLLKNQNPSVSISKDAAELIRELKINQYQFNKLIKKAPYNWVAKIMGIQPI
jgi:hypothetical protein